MAAINNILIYVLSFQLTRSSTEYDGIDYEDDELDEVLE